MIIITASDGIPESLAPSSSKIKQTSKGSGQWPDCTSLQNCSGGCWGGLNKIGAALGTALKQYPGVTAGGAVSLIKGWSQTSVQLWCRTWKTEFRRKFEEQYIPCGRNYVGSKRKLLTNAPYSPSPCISASFCLWLAWGLQVPSLASSA